ncbi:MAG: hypothetical protein Edafosvirus5_3 [Edafosvirus sp.]|uniref:Uncharacterized protein n=1 Tax=Edafosvirus sp. TaxID=2487765 RepID=A0A3G4ZT76_9VIRU|nr:MAG: hypothetical protein Edafosvirus5_3 [Edafosvirus sp.]
MSLDSKIIKLFVYWTNIPIPITSPKYIDYYMTKLDKYYNSISLMEILQDDIKTIGTLELFKNHIDDVMNNVIYDLKSKSELSKYLQCIKDHKNEKFLTGESLYLPKYSNKNFISIDIRSANFTMMKQFYPQLVDDTMSWNEYLSKFTTSKFLKGCKKFREIIFGKVIGNCEKLYAHTIENLRVYTETTDNTLQFSSRLHDEIIYPMSDDPATNQKKYESLKAHIDLKYPNMFHVRMFKLVQLGNKPYFVKEHFEGNCELKKIPKKIIMQCIKYYEKEKCSEIDLKFIDDDMIATYETPVEF